MFHVKTNARGHDKTPQFSDGIFPRTVQHIRHIIDKTIRLN